MMTVEEMMKDANLEPKTINQVIKEFQKAGQKYNGIQCAVALTLLLRILVKNKKKQQMIDAIVDSYDVDFSDEGEE